MGDASLTRGGGQGPCREIEGRLQTRRGDPQRTLGGVSVQTPVYGI